MSARQLTTNTVPNYTMQERIRERGIGGKKDKRGGEADGLNWKFF